MQLNDHMTTKELLTIHNKVANQPLTSWKQSKAKLIERIRPLVGEQKPARGAVTAKCRELILNGLAYDVIVEAVRSEFPSAKTSTRSLASIAADLRREGFEVASRRARAA